MERDNSRGSKAWVSSRGRDKPWLAWEISCRNKEKSIQILGVSANILYPLSYIDGRSTVFQSQSVLATVVECVRYLEQKIYAKIKRKEELTLGCKVGNTMLINVTFLDPLNIFVERRQISCSNPNKVSDSLKLEVMGMSKFSTASKNIKN